jgi:hypothetical protein
MAVNEENAAGQCAFGGDAAGDAVGQGLPERKDRGLHLLHRGERLHWRRRGDVRPLR